jgi:hypothetical protein
MSDLFAMLQAAAGAAGEEVDPYFNQTTLLLHGDGTNGAQNNTFLDSSTNNFTVTRNGNTTQGTFSPFSAPDGRWSVYFAGTNDQGVNCTISGGLSSGDFTVEYWAYHDKFVDFITHFNNTRGATGFNCGTQSDGEIVWYDGVERVRGTTAMEVGRWYHIAFVRSSGVLKGYLNGVQDGTTYSASTNYSDSTFEIGNLLQSGVFEPMFGMISNLRVVVGSALYTSNFTPPTAPLLPSTTNQQLLACYGNRFADFNTATTAKAITITASPKITPFSPFAPTAAYDASVNGGSGYFDGDDYLSIADDANLEPGSSNITFEAWVYLTATPSAGGAVVISKSVADNYGPFNFQVTSSKTVALLVSTTGSSWVTVETAATINTNEWVHLAWTRSGTDLTIYINGTSSATGTVSGALVANSEAVQIGYGNSATTYVTGYIAGLRYVIGSANAISVPTTPPTNITNTALLTNFTNAGIFDQTGKNNLETVGNAQIDTTTKQFGTGSMEFDGTATQLSIPASQDLTLGTGDFTVELWVYPNSWTGNARTLIIGATNAFQLGKYDLNNNLGVAQAGVGWLITNGTLPTTGQWSHVAVTRSGTSMKLFINGTQSGTTYTGSTNFSGSITSVNNSALPFDGYIDDLRITKGVARYTTTFTPPTQAFPNL